MRAVGLALCVLVLGACSLDVQDGVFACDGTHPCPSGFECATDGRCYRDPPSFDASDPLDGNDAPICTPAVFDTTAFDQSCFAP